ncbi:hypothetical protein FRB94_006335 [Tulasnella sp. JGI-2019a]|nr:hypothetical protein FRB94_006335 [Tulasnella sp. JGI-2019a]
MPASSVHFRFAIGEYNWNESYVAQSSKGVIWLNVPDDLSNILRRIPCNDILDYSLGSGGKFYIKWKEGGVIQQKLSRGLWQAIDQDPNTSLNRLTLGAENIYWGVCNGADMFYLLESSFRGQIAKQGSIHSIQNFGFFSLGAEHTFCYNLAGTIYTRAKDTRLKNKIQAAKKSGKAILDVVLSPASTTSWIIMYADGTYDGMLSPDWWKEIKPYFELQHSLLHWPAKVARQLSSAPQDPPAPPAVPKPPIRMLALGSAEFYELQNLFTSGWKHPHKRVPAVVRIFAIDLPQPLLQPYQAYRTRLEQDLGPYRLNEQKTFHGTPRSCCIGDPSATLQLCNGVSCNTCSIIRTSFRVDRAGTAPGRNFMRFGRGIYTTSVSSKADDYNVSQVNSPYKVMLIAKVVLGWGYSLLRTTKYLTDPPENYDSILGTVGEDLNYDEQVVYRDDAIRPAYLLVYHS